MSPLPRALSPCESRISGGEVQTKTPAWETPAFCFRRMMKDQKPHLQGGKGWVGGKPLAHRLGLVITFSQWFGRGPTGLAYGGYRVFRGTFSVGGCPVCRPAIQTKTPAWETPAFCFRRMMKDQKPHLQGGKGWVGGKPLAHRLGLVTTFSQWFGRGPTGLAYGGHRVFRGTFSVGDCRRSRPATQTKTPAWETPAFCFRRMMKDQKPHLQGGKGWVGGKPLAHRLGLVTTFSQWFGRGPTGLAYGGHRVFRRTFGAGSCPGVLIVA
ncbi:hypothetical protein Fbal_0476 [Ferrimonas balearica DSM 9799]|uniref:Uncharacterized protein n=1 Tax=Ferrimonas balearica (strain DSM 9799 / CCM 4581 / KCTC 23876 / PAT) TaxID=550540 RepID=E1SP41_FERBD|nr:hypothetical protein Fbal_0476 [Ferrimonas balearica DSM 9799]